MYVQRRHLHARISFASALVGLFGIACASSASPGVAVERTPRSDMATATCEVPETPTELASTAPPPSGPVERVSVSSSSIDPTCGSALACHGESCCSRLAVPGGVLADARAGQVNVQGFMLDKYELTVGRVRAWVEAGRPVPAADASIGRDSSGRDVHWRAAWKVQSIEKLRGWERYDTWRVNRDDLPKNFLDWFTAAAVCHYAGGRLPNDAEWRYVATGGDENRTFPWGADEQTPERAIYNCMGDGDKSCSLADILPVGSRPLGVGRWGHMDLAGSMFEWTIDAAGGDEVVSRGGGFCYIGGMDRRAKRVASDQNLRREPPATTSHMVGARCAFDAAPKVELASR